MSLSEPTRKMSKSDPEDSYIALLDEPDVIRRKLRRAVTDSDGEIRFDPERKPGVSNLLSILSVLTDRTIEETAASLAGMNYGALKDAVPAAVVEPLSPIQEKYHGLMQDKAQLTAYMAEGAEEARRIARRTVGKFSKKLGLLQP